MKSFLIICTLTLFLTFVHADTRNPFGGSGPFGGGDNAPVVHETFRVSQVNELNRSKLIGLFEDCRKSYLFTENGKIITREEADAARGDKAKSGDPKMRRRVLEVYQRLDSRRFLVKGLGSSEIIYLETQDELDVFDGQYTPPLILERAGEHAYTSVDGSVRNIRAFIQVKEPSESDATPKPDATKNQVPKYTELTRDSFVAALKAGKTFTVTRAEEESCRTCSGRGFISRTGGGLSLEIQRGTCPNCSGSGKTKITKEYTIAW